MAFDPGSIETVSFDSYSTLVDVEAADRALARQVEEPEPISRLWRARSIEYALVSNFIDAYQPFYEMNRDALTYALAAHGVDLSADERDEILAVYHELDVFDDVRDGIERIRDAGYDVYVLSNGDPAMLESMTDHAGIDDLLSDTISADEVRTFKPAPELYRHAASRMGTPIGRIAHVTAGWLDVQGANHAGMQGVWLNRANQPWEPFDGQPALTVESIRAFADRLA